MRGRFRHSMMAIATATVAAAVLWLAVRPTAGQAQAYRAPRTADGKPDLNGIWQALNTANWDIQDHAAQPGPFPFLLGAIGAVPAGQGVVEGNEIPYQPAAAAKKKQNFETRLTVDPLKLISGDPEACPRQSALCPRNLRCWGGEFRAQDRIRGLPLTAETL